MAGGIFVLVVVLLRRGIWGSVAAVAHRLAARRRQFSNWRIRHAPFERTPG